MASNREEQWTTHFTTLLDNIVGEWWPFLSIWNSSLTPGQDRTGLIPFIMGPSRLSILIEPSQGYTVLNRQTILPTNQPPTTIIHHRGFSPMVCDRLDQVKWEISEASCYASNSLNYSTYLGKIPRFSFSCHWQKIGIVDMANPGMLVDGMSVSVSVCLCGYVNVYLSYLGLCRAKKCRFNLEMWEIFLLRFANESPW